MKREGPTTDEVSRAKAGAQLAFISGLESNLGKANTLATNQSYYGDQSHSFAVDYPKAQAVTTTDVKRVANKYFGKGRIVLSVVPVGQKEQASKPELSRVVTGTAGGNH